MTDSCGPLRPSSLTCRDLQIKKNQPWRPHLHVTLILHMLCPTYIIRLPNAGLRPQKHFLQ